MTPLEKEKIREEVGEILDNVYTHEITIADGVEKTLTKLDSLLSERLEGKIEEIKGIEKYQKDLFPEPPKGWQKNLDNWCKSQGYRIDNISAHFARWQEKVVKDDIINLLTPKE